VDDLDRRILDQIQKEFPLDADPYARLAEKVGSEADEVFERVRAMVQEGTIRRLGASFDSRRLGHAATLVALRVPSDRVAEVAALVNRYPEVTHNYERRHAWNLWFTLIARDEDRIREILDQIRRDARLEDDDMMNLPAARLLKIDARFAAR
jgi:DNA-binding Lrp family transcriptional regulator